MNQASIASAPSGLELAVSQTEGTSRLIAFAGSGTLEINRFEGDFSNTSHGRLLVGPTSPHNAQALRETLPYLRPAPLGLSTSAGFGDRLGLATPGHVRASKAAGGAVAPIFAQQSIREMERTGRTPREVLDDATWGTLLGGWTDIVGADADHLKTPYDIDICLVAGYSFFTFDPGEYVDDRAESSDNVALQGLFEGLPWDELEDDPASLVSRYLENPLDLETRSLSFSERDVREAAVKYGRAVAHVARMFRHLSGSARPEDFEVEVSVDETETPTSHAQHAFIARELARLGVRWISLAPRYVGDFEKGVDYIGDLDGFEKDFALHAGIARALGPYKLSLHSGSDKFSIYAATARETRGLIHLKTAGTSYLEALRTIASLDPGLFREIYAFARGRYGTDRASYHVSARLDYAPSHTDPKDSELPGLLDQFDAREILHVTFGSILKGVNGEPPVYRERLMAVLQSNPGPYADNLESHFGRHLGPFVPHASRP